MIEKACVILLKMFRKIRENTNTWNYQSIKIFLSKSCSKFIKTKIMSLKLVVKPTVQSRQKRHLLSERRSGAASSAKLSSFLFSETKLKMISYSMFRAKFYYRNFYHYISTVKNCVTVRLITTEKLLKGRLCWDNRIGFNGL